MIAKNSRRLHAHKSFSITPNLEFSPLLSPKGHQSRPLRVALIGSYVPRQCGIATFTNDVYRSLLEHKSVDYVDVIAVGDGNTYHYPPEVSLEIKSGSIGYMDAAEIINSSEYDVLFLQHEFGLFEGEAGCKLFELLDRVSVPVVTMLHTVLKTPNQAQLTVTKRLVALSRSVITMTNLGRDFLEDIYETPGQKIRVVPHGIPDCSPYNRDDARIEFGLTDNKVAMTFGLIGPGKGLEYAIQAIPAIVKHHPDFIYVLLGATHPNLIKEQGESYRDSLKELAHRLDIEKHLRFENRFVSVQELTRWIKATDVYVTPYLNEAQITSGTLSYAYGCGVPVVSTPYWHAAELLADDRGCLVPFRDSVAIADSVNQLFSEVDRRNTMSKNAHQHGRSMIWSAVSHELSKILKESIESSERINGTITQRFTEIDLRHLARLSDDTGIIQHATCALPNRHEGYCLDDNVRALLLTLYLDQLEFNDPAVSKLQSRYAEFVNHAIDEHTGNVRNFMSYSRQWLEENGSPDSIARTAWTLGACVGRSNQAGMRTWAARLFPVTLQKIKDSDAIRSWVFSLIGIAEYRVYDQDQDEINKLGLDLLSRLENALTNNASDEWNWFEDRLTYDNARLPHALLIAAQSFGRPDLTARALSSLQWLCVQQSNSRKYFEPIGSDFFYIRDGVRSSFDQQPLEAWATTSVCLYAHSVTGDERWAEYARQAYAWFHGQNSLGISMVDASTGGCFDGLHPNRVNLNQGAESTLSWLLADVEMRLMLKDPPLIGSPNHQLIALRRD